MATRHVSDTCRYVDTEGDGGSGDGGTSTASPGSVPHTVRVKRLKAGDHFGYDALLAERHEATVACISDAEVTAVPQHELKLAAFDSDGYVTSVSQKLKEQRKREQREAAERQQEAQILPMMARAALAGEGVSSTYYSTHLV